MPKSTIALSPQCADILSQLRQGPRTTMQLMHATGVMAVAPRIHELRIALQVEHLAIDTRLIEVNNRHGKPCHVAEYSLRDTRRKRVAAVLKAAA